MPNIYTNDKPWVIARDDNWNGITPKGTISEEAQNNTDPIPTAKTWRFTRVADQNQWHGWQGSSANNNYNNKFNLKAGDKLAITAYVKAGWSNSYSQTTELEMGQLSLSDWSRHYSSTLKYKESRISGGGWSSIYSIETLNENVTNGILISGPDWNYSKEAGTMFINGLNWRIIPASNTTAEDILIRKYAKGEQTVAYFQNGGGTPFNDNKFSVSDSGTYTVYVEDKAGNGTVKVIDAKINTYTIKFNGNGSTSGSTASMSMTVGVSKNLTANGFKRTGYTFTGWNTKADGSGTSYANKASVNNLTTTKGATVTLYAQWRKMY